MTHDENKAANALLAALTQLWPPIRRPVENAALH